MEGGGEERAYVSYGRGRGGKSICKLWKGEGEEIAYVSYGRGRGGKSICKLWKGEERKEHM